MRKSLQGRVSGVWTSVCKRRNRNVFRTVLKELTVTVSLLLEHAVNVEVELYLGHADNNMRWF